MKQAQPLKSSLLNMILVLSVVSGLSALILGFIYQITKEPIREANEDKAKQAIEEVVLEGFDNNPYAEKTILTTINGKYKLELYPARQGETITSFAIKSFSNSGFGGKIEMIIGFYPDGTINKYKVIDHKETPGLGTKISEPKFSEQFHGLNPRKESFNVKQDGGEVDAVTAATISSRAVIKAIKRAYDSYHKFSTGE